MKSWHEKVVSLLIELCEEWKKKGKYKKVDRGSPKNVIPINLGKLVHSYQPDIYAYAKAGGVDIYEVLDSQDVNAGIADIILSVLIPNVRCLHMVCLHKKKADELKKVMDIIKGKLRLEDSKIGCNSYIEHIPEDKDPSKIKKILREKLKFH